MLARVGGDAARSGVDRRDRLLQDADARARHRRPRPRARRVPLWTIHRAENRSPEAIRAWVVMLRTVARPDRPIVFALHPGTRSMLEASGESLGPDVRVTEPFGYRSSLTLQLHAAAVLTDFGGIQREAGWLGVPCLVLRSTTEWVELLGEFGGRMSLDLVSTPAQPSRSWRAGRPRVRRGHWRSSGRRGGPSAGRRRRRDHGQAGSRPRGRSLIS